MKDQIHNAENGETVKFNGETQKFSFDYVQFHIGIRQEGTENEYYEVHGEEWEEVLFNIYPLGKNEFHGEFYGVSSYERTPFKVAITLLEKTL